LTTKEVLEQILLELPENRLGEVLDFARFLSVQDESEAWKQFGQSQLAKAYGSDEPEYTDSDLKPEIEG
jgi:hypothetical protein